jgi:drug/metabolite transporter (DMT)-like permease
MNSLYVGTAIAAAMLNGFGFVLQQHAAEQEHVVRYLHLSLIGRLIRNRRWLVGVAVVICGNVLSAWTLGHLTLTVIEPLLTTNLLFALLLAAPLSGQALHRTEVFGAILLSVGVAALSVTRTVRAPSERFGSFSHWPVAAGVIAVIALCLVQLGWQRSGLLRATLTGAASGLVLGIADALTRSSVQVLDGRHPLGLLTTWPGYATVAAAIVGWYLMQSAFSVAPLHASLPAITAAEPLSGMALGVVVFGDVVHVSPWLLALQAAGVAAMVGGVILVARAPVFRTLNLRELPHTALDRLQRPQDISDGQRDAAQVSSPDGGPPDAEQPGALAPLTSRHDSDRHDSGQHDSGQHDSGQHGAPPAIARPSAAGPAQRPAPDRP